MTKTEYDQLIKKVVEMMGDEKIIGNEQTFSFYDRQKLTKIMLDIKDMGEFTNLTEKVREVNRAIENYEKIKKLNEGLSVNERKNLISLLEKTHRIVSKDISGKKFNKKEEKALTGSLSRLDYIQNRLKEGKYFYDTTFRIGLSLMRYANDNQETSKVRAELESNLMKYLT